MLNGAFENIEAKEYKEQEKLCPRFKIILQLNSKINSYNFIRC